jgi:hypothetical protein
MAALGLAVVVAAPSLADNKAKSKPAPKQTAGNKRAEGAQQPDADRRAALHGIHWHPSLEKALAAAAAAKGADGSAGSKKARPVFYLRVLGDLNGFM